MRSTIDAIADDLTEDGLVLRYRNEEGLNADGLTGEEGTFVICSFLCTGFDEVTGEDPTLSRLAEATAAVA
jgi:hypothetical protein